MKTIRTIWFVLLASSLGGCGVVDWVMNWGKQEDPVPVTRPEKVDADAAGELGKADPQPAQDDGAQSPQDEPPADPVEPDPSPRTTPDADANDIELVSVSPESEPNAPVGSVATTQPSEAELISGGSLRINDRFVTPEDIVRAAGEKLQRIPAAAGEQEFRARAARILADEIQYTIQQTLVNAEAQKNMDEQQQRYVDEQVADYRRSMIAEAGSREKLQEMLAKRHTTLEQEMEDHAEYLQYMIYLRQRFDAAIVISRRLLLRYYRTHPKEFTYDSRAQFRLIMVPYAPFVPSGTSGEEGHKQAVEKAKAHAAKAMAELETGKSFVEVAKKYSRGPKKDTGGLWPMMGPGEFAVKEVDKKVFSMEEGEVSEPIETRAGIFVVKAVKVRKAGKQSFEEAQPKIREILRSREQQKLQKEYFSQLYKKANIQQADNFLPRVLEIAEKWFRR
ncbi:MAG: peptidylprolyl isomerase [Phycisphaerae bacterium]